MTLTFSQLPSHIQLQILNKLHFKEFARFRKSSVSSFAISEYATKKLPIKVYKWNINGVNDSALNIWEHSVPLDDNLLNAPVKINCVWMVIETNLTNNLCLYLIQCLEKSFSASGINILADVVCSPELFNRLIQLSKAKKISNEHAFIDLNSPYLQQPAVQKLKSILGALSIHDADLVKLKAWDLDNTFMLSAQNTFVTSVGINVVLKQWQSGERKIRLWDLVGSFPLANDNRLLDGLAFTNVWNSDIHSTTKLSQIPIEKLQNLVKRDEKARVFGLTRESDVLVVVVHTDQLTMEKFGSIDSWMEKQLLENY